jgi:activator of HSP90 ATPase
MTDPIVHKIVITDASPGEIYDCYLNSKMHSEMTGIFASIDPKVGGSFNAYGGISGIILQLEKNRLIVQSWRTDDFKTADPDSIVILRFEAHEGNTILFMVHANVPESVHAYIAKRWTSQYWTPLKKYIGDKKEVKSREEHQRRI